MKKIFKKFASTAFVCASLFAGVNSIEKIQSNQNNETIQIEEQNVRNNGKVFFLQPGSRFNPNDSIYNSYWNNMELFYNGVLDSRYSSAWMLAIESVESVGDNYKIDFYYSFYQNWGSSYYQVNLNLYNSSRSWNQEIALNNIYSNGNNSRQYAFETIQVPKTAFYNENSLVFDISFTNVNYLYYNYVFQVYNGLEAVFSLKNYPYLNDFYVNSFSLVNGSTTTDGFEFLIDARDASTNDLITNTTGLTLYSNGVPLNTQFEGYQGSLLKYKVSGLVPNSLYPSFSVAINGYSGFLEIDNFVFKTNPSGINPNAGVIAGSIIGTLIVLLLIILIVIFALKRRKKVIEYNYYNNYRTFVDQHGNYVKMNQAEYDTLDEEVAAQYQEVDPATTELLDGHYEFTPEN